MNFTLTLHDLTQINDVEEFDFICGYYVGNSSYSLRQINSFSLEDIKNLRKLTKKKIFVNLNKLLHNRELKSVEQYLVELDKINIDYIVFGDFAIANIVSRLNLKLNLIYSTETTITNSQFTKMGFTGVELAKEITLDEVTQICEDKQSLVSVNVQGHLYMYQSVRKLLSNYSEEVEITLDDKQYFLYDTERQKYYPIVENEQGTHILASNDITMIHNLDLFQNIKIDFLKIDTFGYTKKDVINLLELYDKALKLIEIGNYNENKNELLKEMRSLIPYKTFDTGFYFKKTVY